MSRFRRLATSPFWIGSIGIFLLYAAVAYLIDAKPLVEAVRLISIPVFMAVAVAYAGPAVAASADQPMTGQSYLILGIAVAWFSMLMGALLGVVWRLSGQPAWIVNNDLNGFLAALSLYGASLHILAPGAVNGIVPTRNKVILGIVLGMAVLLLLLVALYSPDLTRWVNMLRPYLDEGQGKSMYTHPKGSLDSWPFSHQIDRPFET